jgi:hypothetical protein
MVINNLIPSILGKYPHLSASGQTSRVIPLKITGYSGRYLMRAANPRHVPVKTPEQHLIACPN